MEGKRLDEHGDYGGVQCDICGGKSHDLTLSGMPNNPGNDHECEEDVERKGNDKKRISETDDRGDTVGRLRRLVDEHGTRRCIHNVI